MKTLMMRGESKTYFAIFRWNVLGLPWQIPCQIAQLFKCFDLHCQDVGAVVELNGCSSPAFTLSTLYPYLWVQVAFLDKDGNWNVKRECGAV